MRQTMRILTGINLLMRKNNRDGTIIIGLRHKTKNKKMKTTNHNTKVKDIMSKKLMKLLLDMYKKQALKLNKFKKQIALKILKTYTSNKP